MNYSHNNRIQRSCSSSCEDEYTKDIKQLKADNLTLTERVEKLEKLVNDMIFYRPDEGGYQETKTHFEKISSSTV